MTPPCTSLTDLFFSTYREDVAEAIAICQRCEDRAPCFEAAVANHEVAGVWGGRRFDMHGRPLKQPLMQLKSRPHVKALGPYATELLLELRRRGFTWRQCGERVGLSADAARRAWCAITSSSSAMAPAAPPPVPAAGAFGGDGAHKDRPLAGSTSGTAPAGTGVASLAIPTTNAEQRGPVTRAAS